MRSNRETSRNIGFCSVHLVSPLAYPNISQNKHLHLPCLAFNIERTAWRISRQGFTIGKGIYGISPCKSGKQTGQINKSIYFTSNKTTAFSANNNRRTVTAQQVN